MRKIEGVNSMKIKYMQYTKVSKLGGGFEKLKKL